MAITDHLHESCLDESDVPSAMALVAEAGWNQVPEDWRLFMDLGRTFGLRSADQGLIATAATLPYAAGFEWISMVLVRGTWRRRGLATHLLNRCIESVAAAGRKPVLDATPAGREVYTRLGFHDDWRLTRWRCDRRVGTPFISRMQVAPLSDRDWTNVIALDHAAFGSSRSAVLEHLRQRSRGFGCVAYCDGRLTGFLLGRNGRTATQFGPIVAIDNEVACALISYAAGKVAGPIYVDAVDEHDRFSDWLQQEGFISQRPFTRMAKGTGVFYGDRRCIVAIAGPELG